MQTVTQLFHTRLTEFETFIREGMLPLWRGRGWNPALSCCHERLDAGNLNSQQDFHRLMNLSRQMFVFACAWSRWGNPVDKAHAQQIFTCLTSRFWDAEQDGWYFSIDLAGQPKDRRKDLYGHAFILFGLAHYYRVFKDPAALEWAARTDQVLQNHFRMDRGWYAYGAERAWTIPDAALRQNPHMHLLEAYLAIHQCSGEGRWLDRVRDLAGILETRLLDPALCLIREFFDENAAPCREKGHLTEPGHQFEWYWLLHETGKAIGLPRTLHDARGAMLARTEEKGLDPRYGGIFNSLSADGSIMDGGKRLWPITEYLKALRVREDISVHEKQERLAETLGFLMNHYLLDDGRWHEYLSRDLTPQSNYLPASTMYHLMMAYLVLTETED